MTWIQGSPSSRRSTRGAFNLGAPTELTISSGAVTVTRNFHTIDTESGAASDDLDTINGLEVGALYLLQAEDSARTVVLKNSGNITLPFGSSEFSLNSDADAALLFSPDGSTALALLIVNLGT